MRNKKKFLKKSLLKKRGRETPESQLYTGGNYNNTLALTPIGEKIE